MLSKYQDYILTLFYPTTLEKATSEHLGALFGDSSSSCRILHTTTHSAAQKLSYGHCIISQLISEVSGKMTLNLFRFPIILCFSNVLIVAEKIRGGSDRKLFRVLFPEALKLQNELIGHSKKVTENPHLLTCLYGAKKNTAEMPVVILHLWFCLRQQRHQDSLSVLGNKDSHVIRSLEMSTHNSQLKTATKSKCCCENLGQLCTKNPLLLARSSQEQNNSSTNLLLFCDASVGHLTGGE